MCAILSDLWMEFDIQFTCVLFFSYQIKFSSKIVFGTTVSDALCKLASEGGFDAICVASSGKRGLSKMVVGSICKEVSANATVPVIVIGPRSERLEKNSIAPMSTKLHVFDNNSHLL